MGACRRIPLILSLSKDGRAHGMGRSWFDPFAALRAGKLTMSG